MKASSADLAGRAYWEETWQRRTTLGSVNLKNYSQARFDAVFTRFLPPGSGRALLEAGCAQSSWLPYFRQRFGYEIVGLDYSETGCEAARRNLDRYGVEGTILCRNFLDEHEDLRQRFDVVFSYGVVEHFSRPEVVLERFREFLKPGGLIVTIIPNVLGAMGWLQRTVNRPVYDVHVPMDLDDLGRGHRAAGFEPVWANYVGSLGTEVVNYPSDAGWGMRAVRKLLKWTSKAGWMVFRVTGWHPESEFLSPYVFFIGRNGRAPA